jgi:hypothetical protein
MWVLSSEHKGNYEREHGMKTVLTILGLVLAAALLAGGGFWAGMTYQGNQQDQVRQEFMTQRGLSEDQLPGGAPPSLGRNFPGSGVTPGRSGLVGQVKTVEGSVLTISTAEQVTTVNLSDSTQVIKTVNGDLSDLQPGTRVIVSGETSQAGSLNAVTITLLGEGEAYIPVQP